MIRSAKVPRGRRRVALLVAAVMGASIGGTAVTIAAAPDCTTWGTEGDDRRDWRRPVVAGEVYCGLGGDDWVQRVEAGGVFRGGDGRDRATRVEQGATFYGGRGSDYVELQWGTFRGEQGSDSTDVTMGVTYGGPGDDHLGIITYRGMFGQVRDGVPPDGSFPPFTVYGRGYGGPGDDMALDTAGAKFWGGEGDDYLSRNGSPDYSDDPEKRGIRYGFFYGGPGSDELRYNSSAGTFHGGPGRDMVRHDDGTFRQ